MTTQHEKKRPITAEDLYDLQLAAKPSISPNGDTVAYSVQRVDKKTEKKYSNLTISAHQSFEENYQFEQHFDIALNAVLS